MRFINDDDLSYCLTVSTGIKRETLLDILGQRGALEKPQTFDDFPKETHQPGKLGLLNVFEESDFLITLENSGYLAATRRTINRIVRLGVPVHYVAIMQHSGTIGRQYVEVQNGEVVANFDPVTEEAPEGFALLFPEDANARRSIIEAVKWRMQLPVNERWLTEPTQTYIIDYRTPREPRY